MIIAFHDDKTVEVFSDISSVRGQCEAIDVEARSFTFFNEYGQRLSARVISAVRRTSLPFGMKLVGGGNYELDLDADDKGTAFDTFLGDALAIEPNADFATIADLARFVAENRRRKSLL